MAKETISLIEIHELCVAALTNAGAHEAAALAVAGSIRDAERDGSFSHGIFRLPGFVASLRSGKVDGTAEPELSFPTPALILCDARRGMAPYALQRALPELVRATERMGIAALAMRNSAHFASLWPEVEALAEAGLAGIACTNYLPVVAPAGARERLLGTNPLAFAWPRPNAAPLVFDMATAARALGDVQMAAREGASLPEGIGIDRDGKDTTDPAAILSGALIPFGGYKGSAISLMVELLSGSLIGQMSSLGNAEADNNDGGPPPRGELIIGLNPDLLSGGCWRAEAETFLKRLEAQPDLRLPGQRRHARRGHVTTTVVEADLIETVRALAF
ncbi:Ldh family oxidoreductase [Roseovarius sp.]|uniref:Ldh family oxidoreductase n=1 Tax=Roseovarius sp. TaxID=1486281 RepID=UPI003B596801